MEDYIHTSHNEQQGENSKEGCVDQELAWKRTIFLSSMKHSLYLLCCTTGNSHGIYTMDNINGVSVITDLACVCVSVCVTHVCMHVCSCLYVFASMQPAVELYTSDSNVFESVCVHLCERAREREREMMRRKEKERGREVVKA